MTRRCIFSCDQLATFGARLRGPDRITGRPLSAVMGVWACDQHQSKLTAALLAVLHQQLLPHLPQFDPREMVVDLLPVSEVEQYFDKVGWPQMDTESGCAPIPVLTISEAPEASTAPGLKAGAVQGDEAAARSLLDLAASIAPLVDDPAVVARIEAFRRDALELIRLSEAGGDQLRAQQLGAKLRNAAAELRALMFGGPPPPPIDPARPRRPPPGVAD
jgi:hypothetical protein